MHHLHAASVRLQNFNGHNFWENSYGQMTKVYEFPCSNNQIVIISTNDPVQLIQKEMIDAL